MANPVLCVSCAQLPQKDQSLAVRTQVCPDCNTRFAVTSYGAAFRIKTVPTRKFSISPLAATGIAVGAALFLLVIGLVGFGFWTADQAGVTQRTPERAAPEDLRAVREVALEDQYPANISAANSKQRLQLLIAKIKGENQVGQDQFILEQMNRRAEIRGLPFIMGDACRMQNGKSQSFQTTVEAVRHSFDRDSARSRNGHDVRDDTHRPFWDAYMSQSGVNATNEIGIAALTQMLAPEKATLRRTFIDRLASSPRPEATRMLAKAAVFDIDADIREAARNALKDRARELSPESTEIFLQGMRYPMLAVNHRTAQAILHLERKDMLPHLVAMLDEAAPGDPVEEVVNNKKVCVVREVVRINHHRNCLLCHAPAQTGQPSEVPGVMPIQGSPFPQSQSEAYGNAQSIGDPMIRADTTYLRQDFSVMLPVENSGAWPEKQRFDFLVRSRVVEGKELEVLQRDVQSRPANQLTAHRKTVHELLQKMTGQDAAPNSAAWNRALGIAKAE